VESRAARRADEKSAGGMGLLGIGSVRAGPHQVCQQRRQLDRGIFCVERTGRTDSVCSSLEKIDRGAVQPALGLAGLYSGDRLSRSPK
jgi:hypothetical protein